MDPIGRGSRLAAVVFAGSVALAAQGCGLLLTNGPPEDHEQRDYFTCTESNAGPIIDVVWAGLNMLGALIAATENEDAHDYTYDRDQVIAVGLAWGVVSGTSAAVGFNKTARCREAKRQLSLRQIRERRIDRAPPVADLVVTSVVIVPAADTLTVDGQAQLTATAYDSSAGVVPGRMFNWSSSNDAIASVGASGLVTAHAVGAVVIAARTDNVVGTAKIVVVPGRP